MPHRAANNDCLPPHSCPARKWCTHTHDHPRLTRTPTNMSTVYPISLSHKLPSQPQP
jgi:hypothetical protein